MKKLKKVFLPAIVVMAGIGAAFATNIAKNVQSEPGYYFDNTQNRCVQVENVQCTTTPGDICTWTDASSVTHNLHSFINETMCDDNTLYKQP